MPTSRARAAADPVDEATRLRHRQVLRSSLASRDGPRDFAADRDCAGLVVDGTDYALEQWGPDLLGDMHEDLVPALIAAWPSFVVWSYGTPVAWRAVDRAWTVAPPDRDVIYPPRPALCRPLWVVVPEVYRPDPRSTEHVRGIEAAVGALRFTWASPWL